MSQRTIVEKADIAVANLQASGGYLNPEQADTFIRMVQDQPTLLRSVRTVRMNAPKRNIDKIGFGSRILRAAPSSGTPLEASKRAAPDLGQVVLETKEVLAEVHIPYDVLEDNIERGNLEDTLMAQITERVAVDLEELIVLGDTASADAYLALLDGAVAQATASGHVADISGWADTGFKKEVLKEAILNMPPKYLRNRRAMRFYVDHENETEWRNNIATRETLLGDQRLEGYQPVMGFGVPLDTAVHMPNNKMLFCDPRNLIWGVQRQIMIESERDIRARALVVVVTLRVDFKVEEPDAVVLVTGIVN